MAKIGIDIRLIGKNRTGDEAVFFNLVREFARSGSKHEFKLFTDESDKQNLKDIERKLEIAGKENFEIISLPTRNKFDWNFFTLPAYLRKNPVDVYHTQYITPWFVPKSIKIITIIHDISFNFFPHLIKKADLFFLKTLIPLSIKRADKVIGVSQFTRDEIIKYYKTDPQKVDFVYNSIGEEFLGKQISPEKIREIKNKYDLPEKFILYLGTLQPRKNIPFMIEGFAKMKDKLKGTKLVICGNKKAYNFDKGIDRAVDELNLQNDVMFAGFIDEEDKIFIYKMAHVFVFPSLYEGFGIPLLEAMSAGVPVLASDILSLREIAQNAAVFFDPKSLDNFSDILYNVCENNELRKELTQKGTSRVSFFSWKKSAEKMLAIYEDLYHN